MSTTIQDSTRVRPFLHFKSIFKLLMVDFNHPLCLLLPNKPSVAAEDLMHSINLLPSISAFTVCAQQLWGPNCDRHGGGGSRL